MSLTPDADTRTDQRSEEDLTVNKESSSCNENSIAMLSKDHTDSTHFSVLLCMGCRAPLVKSDDIIAHRADSTWTQQVYAYELDLFDDKPPLWCYSATNPTAHRFDLVCCSPTIATSDHLVNLHGSYSSEHSFFVDHMWCYCECGTCGTFIGWGFSRVGESCSAAEAPVADSREPSFIGLILTKCTGKDAYPVEDFEKAVRKATDRHQLPRMKAQLSKFFSNMCRQMEDQEHAASLNYIFNKLAYGSVSNSAFEAQRDFIHRAVDFIQAEGGQSESDQNVRSELELFMDQSMRQIMEQEREGGGIGQNDDRAEAMQDSNRSSQDNGHLPNDNDGQLVLANDDFVSDNDDDNVWLGGGIRWSDADVNELLRAFYEIE